LKKKAKLIRTAKIYSKLSCDNQENELGKAFEAKGSRHEAVFHVIGEARSSFPYCRKAVKIAIQIEI
jgi:hypothetical protein